MNNVLKRALKNTLFFLVPSIVFGIIMLFLTGGDYVGVVYFILPVNIIFFLCSYSALALAARGASRPLILGIVNVAMLCLPYALYHGLDLILAMDVDGLAYVIFIYPICIIAFLIFAISSFALVEKRAA